jgi:hypothetical protein
MENTANPLAPVIASEISFGPDLTFSDALDAVGQLQAFNKFVDTVVNDVIHVAEVAALKLSEDILPNVLKQVTSDLKNIKQRIETASSYPVLAQNLDALSSQGYFWEPQHALIAAAIQGWREAGMIANLSATNGAYGLLMVMPQVKSSIDKLFAEQPSAAKPIIDSLGPYFRALGVSEYNALVKMKWPKDLKEADSHWQLPYNLYVWTKNLDAITKRYFTYTSDVGWKPTKHTTNQVMIDFIAKHPEWFCDHDYGLAILLIMSLANGVGGSFTNMKVTIDGKKVDAMVYKPDQHDMLSRFVDYGKLLPYADRAYEVIRGLTINIKSIDASNSPSSLTRRASAILQSLFHIKD